MTSEIRRVALRGRRGTFDAGKRTHRENQACLKRHIADQLRKRDDFVLRHTHRVQGIQRGLITGCRCSRHAHGVFKRRIFHRLRFGILFQRADALQSVKVKMRQSRLLGQRCDLGGT